MPAPLAPAPVARTQLQNCVGLRCQHLAFVARSLSTLRRTETVTCTCARPRSHLGAPTKRVDRPPNGPAFSPPSRDSTASGAMASTLALALVPVVLASTSKEHTESFLGFGACHSVCGSGASVCSLSFGDGCCLLQLACQRSQRSLMLLLHVSTCAREVFRLTSQPGQG